MVDRVHFIIYFSKAVKLMTEPELQFLLEQSRRNNMAGNVTGMLVYLEGRFLTNIEGRFMQLLEGPESEVTKIFNSIKKDDRHDKIIVLKQGLLEQRLFDKWSMGFKKIAAGQNGDIPGFFNVDAGFLEEHMSAQQHEVLNFFRSFYTINNEKPFF